MSEGEHYDPFAPHLHGKPEGLIGKKAKEPELTTTEKLLTKIAEKGEREESEKKLNPRKRIEAEARRIKEEGSRPEAWLTLVLGETSKAEARSEKDKHRSDEDDSIWSAVEDVIEEMPVNLGEQVTDEYIDPSNPARPKPSVSELARYLQVEYPDGLYLKDRLKVYFNARKHLNDRYVEIVRADGSLTAMGLGKEDVPFEGISYKVQKVDPADWWAIYHGDEMFPEVQRDVFTESSELIPDVDVVSSLWLEVGTGYKKLPEILESENEETVRMKLKESRVLIEDYFRYKATGLDRKKLEDLGQVDFKSEKEAKSRLDSACGKYKCPEDYKKYRPKVRVKGGEVVIELWSGVEKLSAQELYEFYHGKTAGKDNSSLTKLSEEDIMTIYEKPNFSNSRNSADKALEIRKRIRAREGISEKGEDLAFRALTVSLTFPLFDKDRQSVQGPGQDRDLMWGERARIFNFGEKEREPGVDWTVGRYFVVPDQKTKIDEDVARGTEKMRRRQEKLEINTERGVLGEDENYFEGEVVGDFFHTFVFVPDSLTGGSIRRTIMSYTVDEDGKSRPGGFKRIPFLRLGQNPYQGYFSYTLGKAKQIDGEMSGTTWQKPEELTVDDFWNKRRDLFERLEHVSPRLVDREFRWRGYYIRQALGGDEDFWKVPSTIPGNQKEQYVEELRKRVKKISGFSEESDLDILPEEKKNLALAIIRSVEVDSPKHTREVEDGERSSSEVEKVKIVKAADEQAELFKNDVIQKMRMVHALGVVWPGSLDALEGTSTLTTASAITPAMLRKIILAIQASNYLVGDYLEQFRYEAWQEMGFGEKWSARRKKRYRL